jgi:micrococcal nuclease
MRRLVIALAVVLAAALAGGGVAQFGGSPDRPERDARRARVLRVVDGDTILVRLDGRRERVRYIGIDTPESVKPGTRVQCFGKAAAAANRRLVEGREVRLEYDAEPRDRYGRLLAYVYRDELLVNAELIRQGYAKPLEVEPNLAHAAQLRRLAASARRAHRGLWSRC